MTSQTVGSRKIQVQIPASQLKIPVLDLRSLQLSLEDHVCRITVHNFILSAGYVITPFLKVSSLYPHWHLTCINVCRCIFLWIPENNLSCCSWVSPSFFEAMNLSLAWTFQSRNDQLASDSRNSFSVSYYSQIAQQLCCCHGLEYSVSGSEFLIHHTNLYASVLERWSYSHKMLLVQRSSGLTIPIRAQDILPDIKLYFLIIKKCIFRLQRVVFQK